MDTRSAACAVCLMGVTAMLSACSAHRTGAAAPGAATAHRSAALVFSGPATARWARGSGNLYFDRFEYDRRDEALNATSPLPLLATNQWLQPTPPPERPVRFRRWEQR